MQTHVPPTTPPWITSLTPRPHARLRLFCLPSAGGGSVQYRPWAQSLPDDIELCAVQLPGREVRLREAPFRHLPALIEAIGAAIGSHCDRPFAIFGHSMGALLAFELTRWLRQNGGAQPTHLFLSGRRAAQIAQRDQPLHTLDDAAFIRAITARYNGIPKIILDDAELLQLFLPTLRADLEVIETYEYAQQAPLDCSITAFAGREDKQAPAADLEPWRMHTTREFNARYFPGDHFYLQPQRAALITEIVRTLGASTPQPASPTIQPQLV